MKIITAFLFFAIVSATTSNFSSCGASQTVADGCIDKSKIDNNGMCTADYDPVCGCDGKTYSNSCEASKKGVTKWTKGACPK